MSVYRVLVDQNTRKKFCTVLNRRQFQLGIYHVYVCVERLEDEQNMFHGMDHGQEGYWFNRFSYENGISA